MNFGNIILYSCFVIIGLLCAFVPKFMLNTTSYYENSSNARFQRPIFISCTQYIGTSLVSIFYMIRSLCFKQNLPHTTSTHQAFWGLVLRISCIAFFEVLSTTVSMISLTDMPLGDWHLLRGAFYIFDYILSYIFYRPKVFLYQIIGLVLIFVATSIIMIAYSLFNNSQRYIKARSILFVMLSQFFQATQILIECKFLTDRNDPVEMIIGLQGLSSIIICITFIVPLFHFVKTSGFMSLNEDIFETFGMIKNSNTIMCCIVFYILLVMTYHILSVFVIERAFDRTKSIIGSVKSILLLILLALVYLFDKTTGMKIGAYSIIVFCAALVEVFGFLVYDRVIKFSKLAYPPKEEVESVDVGIFTEEDSLSILRSDVSMD